MLSPTDAVDELFQSILRDVMTIVDAPDGHIAFVDEGKNVLIIQYAIGIYESIIGENFPNNPILKKKFLKGDVFFIEDYGKNFLLVDELCLESVTSMIIFPFKKEKSVIGTCIVSWRDIIFRPTRQEINVLKRYTSLVDIVLEHIRINRDLQVELYECNQEHNREEADHLTKRRKLEVSNEKLGLVNNELKLLSSTDHLTDVWNRRKFEQLTCTEMAKAKRYHRELSLLLLDIDHFKMVNDFFGHQMGDFVLIELTRLIQKNIRSTDYLTRWGGDEFAILLPTTSVSAAMELAEKIRALIAKAIFPVVGSVTVSIGVAEFEFEDNLEIWMMRVDRALYLAKTQGRNSIILVPSGEQQQ